MCDAHLKAPRLQQFRLKRHGAGSRLSNPSADGTREVRGLGIHASIEAATHLPANATGLHLGYCSSCAESPQQLNKQIATLPHQQSLPAPLSPMSTKAIQCGKPGEIIRLVHRDVYFEVHTP
jgi:hypothetical protein